MEIELKIKFVGDIEGEFSVPSYQRGYRWGTEQVVQLLDDIYSVNDSARSYCLQPIVVKNHGDHHYELIDGQQRLTTLYLIHKYMNRDSGNFIEPPRFSMTYDRARERSAKFLEDMDETLREENIDFWFMGNAYEAVREWFAEQSREKPKSVIMNKVNQYLVENVKVIWYEVGESEDAIALFIRLNSGKIPLTSSELVKASFLSQDRGVMNRQRQEEIALQWDNMERNLHDDDFWSFLTNEDSGAYPTRIDLVLDLISGKAASEDRRDEYYTFFAFDKKLQSGGKAQDIWREEISRTFLTLRGWHRDHQLYHKIGYLIASGHKSLSEIYELSKGCKKTDFVALLDREIKKSVQIEPEGNYADLSYDDSGDCEKLRRLLLLFNVISVMDHGEGSQWFPFDKFKFRGEDRVTWSLEHIHAQHSLKMNTVEQWREWLRLHIPSIREIGGEHTELLAEMEAAAGNPKLDRASFEEIQGRTVACLSEEGSGDYLHSIANLALLNSGDNTALSNSTFDVKRNQIIKMDKEGAFIPFCTRMAFLKYYTPSEGNQLHFWGHQDRVAYVRAMNDVLKDYLSDPIAEPVAAAAAPRKKEGE